MNPWLVAEFTKRFSETSIHGALNWHDRPHRVTALYGPSGCGKTTILRCLAGLERLDAGHIQFFNETWSDAERRIHISPQRRRVGFLFQDYMLFPHLRVRDNIRFGARNRLSGAADVEQLISRFQLSGLVDRSPRELSGGQQQRVALARVLAAQPRLLCLDEPLSALDGPTRIQLRLELRGWLQEVQLPTLIVSHDPIEVQSLAEDVVIISDGKTRQSGTVTDVWQQPVDAAVARIVGFDNFVPVSVVGGHGGEIQVGHQDWQFRGATQTSHAAGARVLACIRAEDLRLIKFEPQMPADETRGAATVVEVIPEGGAWRIRMKLATGFDLQVLVSRQVMSQYDPQPNAQFQVEVARGGAVIVPPMPRCHDE